MGVWWLNPDLNKALRELAWSQEKSPDALLDEIVRKRVLPQSMPDFNERDGVIDTEEDQ